MAAVVWLNCVWTRPVVGCTSDGSASRYVPFSFCRPRQSITSRGRSWVSASSSSTSCAVDGVFAAPVRFSAGSCSFTNSTSPSCLGELMLKRSPAIP